MRRPQAVAQVSVRKLQQTSFRQRNRRPTLGAGWRGGRLGLMRAPCQYLRVCSPGGQSSGGPEAGRLRFRGPRAGVLCEHGPVSGGPRPPLRGVYVRRSAYVRTAPFCIRGGHLQGERKAPPGGHVRPTRGREGGGCPAYPAGR